MKSNTHMVNTEFSQTRFVFPGAKRKKPHLEEELPIDKSFPISDANAIAEIESYNKHLFRPNTYLHKWWARRSGTTFRYILKQLIPEKSIRNYYAAGGLDGVTILDPMMGGGTTLHEAIRLGANVIGYDVDPIPVLQAKASLVNVDVSEKSKIFESFFNRLSEKLGPFYKTKCPKCSSMGSIQFTLYGLRKKLENKNLVVIDSEVIRVEPDGKKLRIDAFYPNKEVCFKGKGIRIISKSALANLGNKKNISEATDLPFYKRYIPLVIQSTCPEHSTYFKAVDSFDLSRIKESEESSSCKIPKRNFAINEGPKSKDLIRRNINHYSELFYPRQTIYLNESKKLIQKVSEEHRLWLSLLISTSLEFNSALCGYKGSNGVGAGVKP